MINYIYGIHTVYNTIKYNETRAIKLLFYNKNTHLELIYKIAIEKKIPFKYNKNEFNKYKNIKHQGVILFVVPFKYNKLDNLLKNKNNKLILFLEHVQNPFNLGRIARMAFVFGVNFLIITKNKSSQITATSEKSSTGLISRIPIVIENDLKSTIIKLKNMKFNIVGTSIKTSLSVSKYDFSQPSVLIIGNEKNGIKLSTLKLCDTIISIPTMQEADCLNVADATSIFLYEAFIQKLNI